MSDKNYVAICSNCGRALEICRDDFSDDLKYDSQVVGKWVKRKPLPDGSLELTSEELCKFNQLMELTEIKKVFVKNGFIYYTFFDLDIILSDVKAILYLADLFDLTDGK